MASKFDFPSLEDKKWFIRHGTDHDWRILYLITFYPKDPRTPQWLSEVKDPEAKRRIEAHAFLAAIGV